MNAPISDREKALMGMGESRLRKEDARFIQGKGNYVDDIKMPGMVFMDIVRSPVAHARIKRINKEEALKVPGVIAVLTAEDLKPLKLHWMPTPAGDVAAVLADEKVHFQIQGLRPLADTVAFAPQRFLLRLGEVGAVTDPDVEIAGLGIGDGADAAHQIDRLDGVLALRLAPVLEALEEPPGGVDAVDRREVVAQAAGRLLRFIAGQQGMIEMEQQRQQFEEYPLPCAQVLLDTQESLAIECQEAALDRGDVEAVQRTDNGKVDHAHCVF